MDDVIIEKTGGVYWVEGGPVLIGQAFRTEAQALRFARAQAGESHAIVLQGERAIPRAAKTKRCTEPKTRAG